MKNPSPSSPSQPASASTRTNRLLTLVLALALIPLLLKVPAAAEFTRAILTYPFQVDDSEGVILSEAQWLARGVDPYQPARPDFFTAAPYTPIFTVLNAAAFAAGPFTFKVGRGIAWLATLAAAVLIGALVRRRTRSTLLAIWAALAILTINLVSVWSVRARPDHLALAFNLAGFALISWHREALTQPGRREGDGFFAGAQNDRGYVAGLTRGAVHPPSPLPVILNAVKNPSPQSQPGPGTTQQATRPGLTRAEWRFLALAATCFALGFFTKQTLLAAPLAVGLWLLLARPRLGIAFGLFYAALVLVPFGLLTLATRGGFYQHIVAFHSSWAWHDFLRLGQPFVARYWPLLLAGAALPLAVLATAARHPLRRLRADPDLLPATYLLTAAGFSLGAGTHGGNHNHFVETVVVAIYCAALLANRLMRAEGGRRRADGEITQSSVLSPQSLLGVALLLALSVALAGEARFGGEDWLLRDFRTPRPLEREGWRNVAAFVTNDPGPVYSDNVGLLLIAGKEVRYTDPFSLAYAARTGQWDDSALVARVERGEFSLIALRYDIFAPDASGGGPDDLTPGLYRAIRARYRVIERNVMTLYVPR